MVLNDAIEKLRYDKRLLDFHLKNNLLSQDELNRYLQSLADVAENVGSIDLTNENRANGETVESDSH